MVVMAARQAVIAVTEIVRLLIRHEVPVAAEVVLVAAAPAAVAMETAVAHPIMAVVVEAAANRESRQGWYVFKREIGRIIQINDIHIGRACKAHFLSLSRFVFVVVFAMLHLSSSHYSFGGSEREEAVVLFIA